MPDLKQDDSAKSTNHESLFDGAQPRTWSHAIEFGTPAFAERDSDSTRQLIEEMSLRKFVEAGLVLTVYSAALGERVIFASNDVPLEEQMDGLSTYRAAELNELVGLSVDQLHRIHALKKKFRAVIEFVSPSLQMKCLSKELKAR